MKQYGKILPKTLEDLIELAREQGWHISKTTSGHPRLQSPKGDIVIGSSTSGDSNWIWDFRSRLKRAGLRPAKSRKKERKEVTHEKVDPPVEQKETPVPPAPAHIGVAMGAVSTRSRGELKELVLEALRKHNRPEGVKIAVVREYISFKTGREYTQGSVNTSLASYVKSGEVVRVSNGYYRARDSYELHEVPPAVPTPAPAVQVEVNLPEVAPPKVDDEDAEIDKAMEQIMEGLGRLENIVRKTKEMRKKLREILGGIT